uniref:t-SNARE coiled-coil homology domain-containing protein n=1 Tax=viral metagenome TaxID=1070528 RepID=A0A6C0H639_9ZZZZ
MATYNPIINNKILREDLINENKKNLKNQDKLIDQLDRGVTKLYDIANEIKQESKQQNNELDKLEDDIENNKSNIIDRTKSVKTLIKNSDTSMKYYCYVIGILVIILIILIFLVIYS